MSDPNNVLDHVGLRVRDVAASRRFHEAALAPLHLAFHAVDRERVDAFHSAALGAGGTDSGAPGVREYYHPSYYAAFVFDPDRNNVEAVCHMTLASPTQEGTP